MLQFQLSKLCVVAYHLCMDPLFFLYHSESITSQLWQRSVVIVCGARFFSASNIRPYCQNKCSSWTLGLERRYPIVLVSKSSGVWDWTRCKTGCRSLDLLRKDGEILKRNDNLVPDCREGIKQIPMVRVLRCYREAKLLMKQNLL